ncbi:hypothetical protein FXO38_25345 [Capsicum annuum]|uniref:Uncharacterized protein n=1 Tax=Capsicum annuum TaxID=4072 RepID=A0A2G2YKF1_CAPAN|nr:hypothetical protein FXO38_25345 [Capsicum annuum]PHT70218.1 hypothetical protein T459_25322 [Capsicum annuum]
MNPPFFTGSKLEEDPQEFLYKDVAHTWYKQWKSERLDDVGPIEWEEFASAFLDRFFPLELREAKVQEFINLSLAHVMPLLEIVRTQNTSCQLIIDLLDIGKKIKKTPVVVRNCTGFTINRMLFSCTHAAPFLVEHGEGIYYIDRAFAKFEMAMGPVRLCDLIGFNVAMATCRMMELTSKNFYGTVSSAIMKLPDTNYVAAGAKRDLDSQLKTMSSNFLVLIMSRPEEKVMKKRKWNNSHHVQMMKDMLNQTQLTRQLRWKICCQGQKDQLKCFRF